MSACASTQMTAHIFSQSFTDGLGNACDCGDGDAAVTSRCQHHSSILGLIVDLFCQLLRDCAHDSRILHSPVPSEPWGPRQLSDKGPIDGPYLQGDVESTCDFAIVAYVKKNLQKASAVLIARMLKKAELLDAGQLHAMIENERRKTVNSAVQNHLSPLGEPQLLSPDGARTERDAALAANELCQGFVLPTTSISQSGRTNRMCMSRRRVLPPRCQDRTVTPSRRTRLIFNRASYNVTHASFPKPPTFPPPPSC
jgi:hypothetical protein